MQREPDDAVASDGRRADSSADAARAIVPFPWLAFGALGWIVINQFRDHLGLHAGDRSGLVAKGYLGADLFLILAGLLACRALAGAGSARGSSYGAMIWRSIAPNYPLHLATIAAMGAMLLAGRSLGAGFDLTPFNLAALPANLLLVHAWGTLPSVYWNFPSWLLSAELAGCLILPALAWMARRGPGRAALLALVLFEAMAAIAAVRGVLFTDMTAQIGALRVAPDFLMGAAIWGLLARRAPSRRSAELIAAACLAWIATGAALRVPDMAIWPAFAGLVFALAARGESAPPANTGLSQRFGRIAYAMYLTYLPVDIVYFHSLRRILGAPGGWLAWAVLAGVFPVILLVGALAYLAVERPAARWLLLQRNPFARDRHRPPAAPAASREDPPRRPGRPPRPRRDPQPARSSSPSPARRSTRG